MVTKEQVLAVMTVKGDYPKVIAERLGIKARAGDKSSRGPVNRHLVRLTWDGLVEPYCHGNKWRLTDRRVRAQYALD